MDQHFRAITGILIGLISAGLSGCGDGFWFGDGSGAEAQVTTPSGVQTGDVTILYSLAGDAGTTDVTVSFSTNGVTFEEATPGPGGDGTDDLSVSPAGESHTFIWSSGEDLEAEREPAVRVRVRPEGGSSGTTGEIPVHNARFAAAVENRAAGRVRLYVLDAVGGDISFIQAVSTGGTDPFDIIHHAGNYFVAHGTSNDIAVLELDEESESLTTVSGSPFDAGGIGSKYLATDGARIFVSNTGSGTVSILDWSSSTGALAPNPHPAVAVAGCRGLVAWSGRLYVAGETSGSIVILDIAADGELIANAASPVTGGGLASPRALALAGTRLYAANFAAATVCGFNFQGSGSLDPIAGSPFAVSSAGVEAIARNGAKLFASAAGPSFLALTIDSFGAVAEDSASPFALTGPSFGAASAGTVAIAPTTTSNRFEVWTIDPAGNVTPASPVDAAVELLRVAISD